MSKEVISQTYEEEPLPSSEESYFDNNPPKKRSIKKLIVKFILLLFVFLLFVFGGLFIWMAGYFNTWMCSIVKQDSILWSQFTCSPVTSTVDEKQSFPYEEKKDKNIVTTDLETVVTKVVEETSNSVVGIGVIGGTESADRIVGSGFIVSSAGLIVTNQHVVSFGQENNFFVVIGKDSEQIKVEKIYRDEINDIALVQVNKKDLKAIPLGDSSKLKVGQTAIAIGNPLGSFSNTVTVGSISALNREVEVSTDVFRFSSQTHFDVIQTDAAINPGNSGGPLINSNGEVIGVNFATISGADNMSFALPINLIKRRIEELNEYGNFRLPFLGVEYQQRLVFYKNEGIIGAVVTNVVPGSPASEAGLVRGDVIVQFNGKPLEDESLLNLIQRSKIGEEVELLVLRDSGTVTLKAKIQDRNNIGS